MSKNTENLNLNLPEYGESNWDKDLNDNFTILDKAVREALDGNTNFIIAPEPPLSPKFGQVWIDTSEGQNSDGLIKGVYKVYNGEDFEEYQFKTDSSLVMVRDNTLEDNLADKDDKITILKENIGNLDRLETDNKDDLVSAINDIWDKKLNRPLVYSVVIDESNSNPETRVRYIKDSENFKPVRGNDGNTDWGSWKDTFIYDYFKPCVYKDGEVVYYLDKDDRTKKEDGSPAILTGEDGDIMVEVQKMWLRMYKEGANQYIKITNKETDGYQCLAHTNGDTEVDKIYIGVYLGYEQNSKLRSISGKEPTGEKTIGAFRTIAEANGDNYHQVPFYALQLLQAIMTIMLCNTDTQTALGRGRVDSNSGYENTGGTNKSPLMYGSTRDEQVCFMGIEGFWGNKRWWIDGCKYDGGDIKTATTGFNNNATDYDTVGKYSTGSGYIENIKGGNKTGFIPDKRDGSGSTYYCDYGVVHDGVFPSFGGYRSDGSRAGGFFLSSHSDSSSYADVGARLFAYEK